MKIKILLILVILILIGFISSFIYWVQFVKPKTEVFVPSKEEVERQKVLKIKEAALEEFNEDFCKNLIPAYLANLAVKEYYTNYHIDGSVGKSVKWIASRKPLEAFSLFEGPEVLFVYSDDKFEGCGFKQELKEKEKILLISEALPEFPYHCQDKKIYLVKKTQELYSQFNLYWPKPEILIETILFAAPDFGQKKEILSNLRCEI